MSKPRRVLNRIEKYLRVLNGLMLERGDLNDWQMALMAQWREIIIFDGKGWSEEFTPLVTIDRR
jgi:hypothetical protein